MTIEQYNREIEEKLSKCFDIANKARAIGKDPKLEVETLIGEDFPARVEQTVGPKGVAEVIRNLLKQGLDREEIAFKVADMIIDGKLGDRLTREQKVKQCIQTGISIMTSAVVAGSIEGIEWVRALKNKDGSEYIQICVAGPIRSCLPRGSFVFANPHPRGIDQINIQDSVLGANGLFTEVKRVYRREYHGKIVKISTKFLPQVYLTTEHPVLVIKPKHCTFGRTIRKRGNKCLKNEKYTPQWVPAGDLKNGDIVVFPKFKENVDIEVIDLIDKEKIASTQHTKASLPKYIKTTPELYELCGWYISKGRLSHNRRAVRFTVDAHKKIHAERISMLIKSLFGERPTIKTDNSKIRIHVSSIALARLFERDFGADEKRLPTWVMLAPTNKTCAFLKGYVLGNGVLIRKAKSCISVSTTSKVLAYQLLLLLNKIGVLGEYHIEAPRDTRWKERYIISISGSQLLTFLKKIGVQTVSIPLQRAFNRFWQDDNNFYIPIHVTHEEYHGEVFNLETSDNTYLAPFVVHNCGGTVMGMVPVLGAYAAKKLGFAPYRPTTKEIGRYLEEAGMYELRQYIVPVDVLKREVEIAVQNSYVAITSGPGSSKEKNLTVATYKNIQGIDDHAHNYVRDGALLTLCEGLFLKSAKLQKITKKLKVDGWEWLKEIGKSAVIAAGGHSESYLERLLGGRAVIGIHQQKGGLALRYGRSRTGGLYCIGIHPSGTYILGKYLPVGNQIVTSYPSKGGTVQPCDQISPPFVRLKNGNAMYVNDVETAKTLVENDEIDRILFNGELLISFGDIAEAGNQLLPPSWCNEWYSLYIERSIKEGAKTSVSSEVINKIIKDITFNPTAEDAFKISRDLGVPLHPRYTYLYNWTTVEKLAELHDAVRKAEGNILPMSVKETLEQILVPHKVVENGVELDKEDMAALRFTFASDIKPDTKDALDYVHMTSGVIILHKYPTIIGVRSGRPTNNPKVGRVMKPPIHVLFPLGRAGGTQRLINKAAENENIKVFAAVFRCPNCGAIDISQWCNECKVRKKMLGDKPTSCEILIRKMTEEAYKAVGESMEEIKTKGVVGLISPLKISQPIEKGILRAKYGLFGFKDGSLRTDITMAPLTAFKPKEIGLSVEKARELGYTKDIHGNELENDDQIVHMYPQDLILPEESKEMFLNVSKYIDDLLEKFYNLERFYNATTAEDLIGHIFLSLSPHTCTMVPLRLIGFTANRTQYNHPLAIAMRRRDCLAAGEVATIKSDKGLEVLPVEEVFNAFISGKNMSMMGYDEKGHAKLSRIVGVYRREPDVIYRIALRGGGDILLTPGHKVPVLAKDAIVIKRAKDISVGDALLSVVDGGPPLKNTESTTNLIDLYSRTKYSNSIHILTGSETTKVVDFINTLGGYKKAAEMCSCSKQEIVDSLRYCILKLTNYIALKKRGLTLDETRLHIRYRKTKERVPAVIDNRKLAYLLGLVLSDGYVRKVKTGFTGKIYNGYQVVISTSSKIHRKDIVSRIKDTFGIVPSVSGTNITMCSRVIYDLFSLFLGVKPTRKKSISPWIFDKNTETIKSFLAGYIAGDGSIDNHRVAIKIASTNRANILVLYSLCNKIGLYPTISAEYNKPPGNPIRKRYAEKSKKVPLSNVYYLRLWSTDAMSLVKYLFGQQAQKLQRTAERHPPQSNDKRMIYNRFIIRTVKEITQLRTNECVYDIELNPKHLFTAGIGNILLHNCDGDTDHVQLALEMLLDFSEDYLPSGQGRLEDAPVVTIKTIDISEIDKQAYGVDTAWKYPLELYEAAARMEHSSRWRDKIECIGQLIGTGRQFIEYGFTHDTKDINEGAKVSTYIELKKDGKKKSMMEKVGEEWEFMNKVRGIPDPKEMMKLIIRTHFVSDFKGNLRSYSIQTFRCPACGCSYRRMPLIGKCVCGGRIIQTVSEGGVRKYITLMERNAERTGDPVLKEEIKEFIAEVNSFFRKPPEVAVEEKPKKRARKKKVEEERGPEEFTGEEGE